MEVDSDGSSSAEKADSGNSLVQVLKATQEENKKLRAENDELHGQLRISRFGIERFSTDNAKVRFYTGFTSYKLFTTFFEWLQPSASCMRSMYYVPSETVSLPGRKRNMLLIDELFMFLCRMRLGLLEEDLADRFNCTVQATSRKILTWLNYMYFVLGSIPIWPPRKDIEVDAICF